MMCFICVIQFGEGHSMKLKSRLDQQGVKQYVFGNWKMNGALAANEALLKALVQNETLSQSQVHCGLCVPFVYLPQTQSILAGSKISFGAQDVSVHTQGAFTGEISADMLKDVGADWVLVGHSERRLYHSEGGSLITQKVEQALQQGITPIVCIGETLEERQQSRVFEVLDTQLEDVFKLGADVVSQIIFAYEPVWAIGTGLSATPEQAQEVHAFIRRCLYNIYQSSEFDAKDQILLYGGSVKPNNARGLSDQNDIDGFLVGGASLDAVALSDIVNALI